ncbi:uncharacterized protein LOC132708155 isoform X1 [Cylas formicarius]|uniref:uncharacterized protein LOC132708155 isoform X1 n=1 Tax=Cylas formicarius TaxID=197179 RepID=UPI002958CB14|nr:uncharacterized protein LOC132708155 isoform X1 [Cylas formicarius]
MSFGERFLVFSCLVCAIGCTQLNNGTVADENRKSSRKSRVLTSYAGLVTCAVKYDADCFIDAAQEYLEDERTDLLAEADAAAYRATGRSDPESKPSHLVDVIGKLITELSKMFEGGFSGFFKSARENDEEDDKNILEEGENDTARANGAQALSTGETRKKGKHDGLIKKLIRLIKLIIYAIVLVIKIHTVLAIFHGFLKLKFLLVTIWALAFFGLKVFLSYKNGADHVVLYEDVKHEHHYEEDDVPIEDWKSSYYGHTSYKDRLDYAQNLAYKKRKPQVSTESPYFWFN